MLIIGQKYYIGFNTAKMLGDETQAYRSVRCEAFGIDWAVFRTREGEALAATFTELQNFVKNLEE